MDNSNKKAGIIHSFSKEDLMDDFKRKDEKIIGFESLVEGQGNSLEAVYWRGHVKQTWDMEDMALS